MILNSAPMADVFCEVGFEIASKWVGMNVLVLKPGQVLIDSAQTALINLLGSYGIESVQIDHSMAQSAGGGTHCMSNEYQREEEFDFNKILETPTEQLT